MKALLTILLFTISVSTRAVTITQFYAGAANRNMDLIVWTADHEQDITGYIIEKNGAEVWTQESGGFESAGYYFYTPTSVRWFTIYTLKIVYPDGQVEVRAQAYVIARWWKWW